MLGGGSQVVLGTVDGLQSLSPTGHTAVPKGSGRNRDRRPHRAEVHPVPHLLSFRACSECSRFDQGEKGGRHSFQNVLVGFLPAQGPFPDSAQCSPGRGFRIWVQVVPSLHRLGHGPSGRWLSCAESTAGKGMNTTHCSWSWTHPSTPNCPHPGMSSAQLPGTSSSTLKELWSKDRKRKGKDLFHFVPKSLPKSKTPQDMSNPKAACNQTRN